MSQIITVDFAPGQVEAIAAQPLEQWAYGQTLRFTGLELPEAYQVDFSNFEFCGSSVRRVGGADGVPVPISVLTSGRNVYAFVWLQDTTSGRRYARATIRVIPGPAPDTEESPEEQSAVTDAINALNAAAEDIPEQVGAAIEEAIESGKISRAFFATYGETTAAEIVEADAAGLIVYCRKDGQIHRLTRISSGVCTFAALAGNTNYTLRVSRDDEWSSVGNVMAPLTSPAFAGAPTAPTAPLGTENRQIATTAFVKAAIDNALENLPEAGVSEELKQALLQIAAHVAYIDDQGQTYYQALYDALYPPAVLASIQAAFAQGSTVIYNTDSLDVLKPLLTVTAVYDDRSTETVPAEDYTLSGTLATGTSTITASYQGKTTTFDVVVTAAPQVYLVTNELSGCTTDNGAAAVMENEPYSAVITPAAGYTLTGASVVITMAGSNITASAYSNGAISIPVVTGALVISIAAQEIVLSSISAAYTQSGTVYDTDSLDSLKADLVVTAIYSDSSTQTVAAEDYTLSGTLTVGTSTITVSYGGKTTTFSVTVTAEPVVPVEYQQVEYLQAAQRSTANGVYFNTGRQFSAEMTQGTFKAGFQQLTGEPSEPKRVLAAPQKNSSSNIGWGLYVNAANAKIVSWANSPGAAIDISDPYARYDMIATYTSEGVTLAPVGGSTVSFTGTSRNCRETDIGVFGTPNIAVNYRGLFHGRVFYAQAEQDGELIFDLIPCVRKSDNTVGFYDRIGRRFLEPLVSGTGAITDVTAGPVV